jgi:hypothetical protein
VLALVVPRVIINEGILNIWLNKWKFFAFHVGVVLMCALLFHIGYVPIAKI